MGYYHNCLYNGLQCCFCLSVCLSVCRPLSCYRGLPFAFALCRAICLSLSVILSHSPSPSVSQPVSTVCVLWRERRRMPGGSVGSLGSACRTRSCAGCRPTATKPAHTVRWALVACCLCRVMGGIAQSMIVGNVCMSL